VPRAPMWRRVSWMTITASGAVAIPGKSGSSACRPCARSCASRYSTTAAPLAGDDQRIQADHGRHPHKYTNGDAHHPHLSYTDGSHDGRYLYINDKANSRVARIRLDIFKPDAMVTIPNIQAVHGLRLQKAPQDRLCLRQWRIPHPQPNDGRDLENTDKYWTLWTAVDGETMEVAWQVMVDGNLDNMDADYTGKYAAATCYNSEKATTLSGMQRAERDWGRGCSTLNVLSRRSRTVTTPPSAILTFRSSMAGMVRRNPLCARGEEPARLQHLNRRQVLHLRGQARPRSA